MFVYIATYTYTHIHIVDTGGGGGGSGDYSLNSVGLGVCESQVDFQLVHVFNSFQFFSILFSSLESHLIAYVYLKPLLVG